MEPTAADLAAVSAAIDQGQPAPAPAPAAPEPQQQPQAPVAQPTPSQQPAQPTEPTDPFATLFTPQAPTTPVEPSAPTVPVEPAAPTQVQPTEPQPNQQQPVAPVEPTQPTQQPQTQSFDDYMNEIIGGIGQAPEMPDASKIDPTDDAGIKNFFDDLVNTAVEKATQNIAKGNAIQTKERQLWDEAFVEYGTLRTNKGLRDTVHAIRMGDFNKGIATTPKQAAAKLVNMLKEQYSKGIADNQVITTIENVQPNGGGSSSVDTSMGTQEAMQAISAGGETALTAYLDSQIKAGKL